MTADDGSGKPFTHTGDLSPTPIDDRHLVHELTSLRKAIESLVRVTEQQVVPALSSLTDRVSHIEVRVDRFDDIASRFDRLEQQVGELIHEATRRRPSTRRKAAKRKASKSARPKLRR